MRLKDSTMAMLVRRTPLAACLATALALGLSAPAAAAPAGANLPHQHDAIEPLLDRLARRAAAVRAVQHGTRRPEGGIVIPVTSCEDDGSSGTLRHALLTAASGDTVDLSALTCSTITLSSGALSVDVDDLLIAGPGASRLTIDANHASRVFRHGGAGTLQLSNLTAANGTYSPISGVYGGGCIYSAGSVSMTGTTVTGCAASADGVVAGGAVLALDSVIMFGSAVTDSHLTSINGDGTVAAAGGGVFAESSFLFEHSIVSGNTVTTPLGLVYGGGALSKTVTAKYSTIHGNSAMSLSSSGNYGIGGGVMSTGNVFVQNSTFDNNEADGGGALDTRYMTGYTATFINSTISGNHANILGGGILAETNSTFENCTIAFNYGGAGGGGGLIVGGATATLESTIIADNSPSAPTAAADLDGSATVSGANNLIKISGIAVPADTITDDPQLGTLAANGGETRTLALAATSPAIDTGNDAAGANHDQRGPKFPRSVGALPDIGAYELNADVIFDDGFDAGG